LYGGGRKNGLGLFVKGVRSKKPWFERRKRDQSTRGEIERVLFLNGTARIRMGRTGGSSNARSRGYGGTAKDIYEPVAHKGWGKLNTKGVVEIKKAENTTRGPVLENSRGKIEAGYKPRLRKGSQKPIEKKGGRALCYRNGCLFQTLGKKAGP